MLWNATTALLATTVPFPVKTSSVQPDITAQQARDLIGCHVHVARTAMSKVSQWKTSVLRVRLESTVTVHT